MTKTELIFAPGTSPAMKKAAESLPPYDLLKAYREAAVAFRTNDIVIVVATGDNVETFEAFPRSEYIKLAFRRWNEKQMQVHPLAKDPAYKRLQTPADSPAFWLVVEAPEAESIGCCAIGAFLHRSEPAELS